MNEKINDYNNKTNPTITLIDKHQLLYFLNGFSHMLKADITISYMEPSGEIQRLDSHKDVSNSKINLSYFCRLYRDSNPKHAKACLECDKNIALKYYQGIWKKPMLYCCHMGLWDMSYPLYIKNTLIGVIFAGQIIVNEDMDMLRKKLYTDVKDKYDHTSCLCRGNQIDIIIERIQTNAISNKELLIDLLNENTEEEKNLILYEDLISRFEEFNKFGNKLVSLITKLHSSVVLIEQMNLINTMSAKLSGVEASDKISWGTVWDVVDIFKKVADLDDFDVYYRQKSYYIHMIGKEGIIPPEKARLIPLDKAMGIPVDVLIKPVDILGDEEFLSEYDVNNRTLIYRSEVTDFENRNISTLLLVSNPAGEADNKFIEMFCEMLSIRMKVSGIFEQMIKERQNYKDRVRIVTHNSRTMLHNAISITQQAWKNKQANSVIKNNLIDIERFIKLAKLEISELDEQSKAIWENRDLIPVIDEVIKVMDPLLFERACTIEIKKPSTPLIIYMNYIDIKIALMNLIENAVKYSYKRHIVNVYVTVPDKNRIIIDIVNYGIGIPDEMLEKIRKVGQRAKIPDLERSHLLRTGSGYGLPIAIDFIEEHNGFLQIKSVPADNNEREPYLRYVTTVSVTLPHTKKGEQNNEA